MNILKHIKYTILVVALACTISVSAYAKEPDRPVESPRGMSTWDAKAPSTPTEVTQELTQTLKSIVDLPSARKVLPKLAFLSIKLAQFSEAEKEQDQPEFGSACLKFTIVLLSKRATFKRLAKQDELFGLFVTELYNGFDDGLDQVLTELGR